MGAYENPGMVRDVSGQIINQGIAQIGKSFTDAINTFATLSAQSGAAARKEAERVQRVGYQVETKAWDNANRNSAFIAKENPGLSEQFGDTVGELLRGVGQPGDENYQMGAIEAETMLATKSGLSNEERKYLQGITQRAKSFQNFGIAGGGKIISDLEDMEGVRASDLNSTHYWVGRTKLEQDTSMLTAYGLNNKQLDGLTTIKKLIPGEKGEMIVRVTSKIKEGSKAWNDLSDSSKEEVRRNKGEIVWERNINEWDRGLIHKIPEGLDVDKIAMNSQFMSKQGKITNSYMKGGENANVTNYQAMPGKPGVEKTTTFNYIDVNKLTGNEAFMADINARATVLEAMDPGELQAFANKMGGLAGGEDAYDKFLDGKTKPERINYLTEQLTEKFLATKLGGITKRKATDQDVKNWQDNGFEGELIKGVDEVYIQPVSSGQRNIPGYSASTVGESIGGLILKEIDDIEIKTEKDIITLSGLKDDEVVEKGNAYRQENIREHKKYLNEKGIRVKTRDEIIKGYKALEGTKATKTSSPYTKEDINRFIEGLGDYELFDENEEPFVSYNPYKNTSLIPIIQTSKGYTAKQNETLGKGNIRPDSKLSNYNIE